MATVFIPTLMQDLSNGNRTVNIEGSTVREIINNLDLNYPGFKGRLIEGHKMKKHISVAVDGIITPIGLLEKVSSTSEIHFLPAVSGGSYLNYKKSR
jgi:molybdopterin converting factor small subunit